MQNLFSGTLTGSATLCTTNRNCAVVAPIPSNLPEIEIVGVAAGQFFQSVTAATGSLSSPDVTLPGASAPVSVRVDVFTKGVPNGDAGAFGTTVPATLRFRAVGTDGGVVEADGVVGTCDCSLGEGVATATLPGLKPGVTYQIVVVPRDGAYPLAALRGGGLLAAWKSRQETEESVAAKWERIFGVESPTAKRVARITVLATEAQRHGEE